MMDSSNKSNSKRKFLLTAAIIIAAVILAVAAFLYLRQPNVDDYKMARDTRIIELSSARDKLQPAVNKYLASYKRALNESGNLRAASKKSKPQYDEYKTAERNITTALKALTSNRIANSGATATAVDQLEREYVSELAYFGGMVDSYGDYTALFSDKEQRCNDIFVGDTTNLADRRKQLDAAAKRCYAALKSLKTSRNVSIVDYAKKVERRVKLLQGYSVTTAAAEAKIKDFESELVAFQKRFDEAKARNASEAELFALADEIKAANGRIEENKSQFEYAASRYVTTVKEMPKLYGAVFDTSVPAKVKNFNQLIEGRTTVLNLLLEAKIGSA